MRFFIFFFLEAAALDIISGNIQVMLNNQVIGPWNVLDSYNYYSDSKIYEDTKIDKRIFVFKSQEEVNVEIIGKSSNPNVNINLFPMNFTLTELNAVEVTLEYDCGKFG